MQLQMFDVLISYTPRFFLICIIHTELMTTTVLRLKIRHHTLTISNYFQELKFASPLQDLTNRKSLINQICLTSRNV